MSEKKSENKAVIVLGKTGVGKSSLCNYVFGTNFTSGIGKPIMSSLQKKKFVINDIGLNVFDTAGIEVDNITEWYASLNAELCQLGSDSCSDWIFIYCISSAGGRVENIDVQIIGNLLKAGYKVVVALTKADQSTDVEKEKLKESLLKELQNQVSFLASKISILSICAVQKQTRVGTTKPFGRNELLDMIFPQGAQEKQELKGDKNMENFRLNIVTLGKTGVGKSSLLNYLFETDFTKGAGRPQTPKKSDDPKLLEADVEAKGHKFHLFDSWGIEADKLPEWQAMLDEMKEKHDGTKETKDWFHAIIYCVSAGGARVENIDAEIISDFIKLGYNVVVALTKIDQCTEDEEAEMKEVLKTTVREKSKKGDFTLRIVPVCAEEKVTRMGKTKQAGRDELINAIILSWVETVKRRVPVVVKERLNSNLDAFKSELEKFIDGYNISGRREGNDKLTKELEAKNTEKMNELVSKTLNEEVNKLLKECYDIGCKLQNSFGEVPTADLSFSFTEFDTEVNKNLLPWYMVYGLTIGVLPVLNSFLPFMKEKQSKKFKDELLPSVIQSDKQYLADKIIPQLQGEIEQILDRVSKK